MLDAKKILNEYGAIMQESIKTDVSKVSATGQTANSVNYSVTFKDGSWILKVKGRKFFTLLETGRGPRKASTYQEFDLNLQNWMKARGIGAGLPKKKFEQLAKFIAYKINKEGDATFKRGGRQVYSENLGILIDELKAKINKEFKSYVIKEIKDAFNQKNP